MSIDAVGSPWTLALDLSRAFEDRGVEVVLVALGRQLSDSQRRDARAISTLTLHDLPLRSEWMDDPWDDVERAGEQLLSFEQHYAPDIVQLGSFTHGALPFQAPVILSAHASVLAWWQAAYHVSAPRQFDLYRERAGRGLRAAQAIVSSSESQLRELVRHHGPIAPGHVIPTGCDPGLFSPDDKEQVVCSASRSWDGFRNLAQLSQAAARIRWPVAVAADDTRPPGEIPVSALAQVDQDTSPIHTLGRLSRAALAEHLGRSAIYALPGSLDSSGLSVLEAALSGCALVLGASDTIREVWQGAAVFVPPEAPTQLASAINDLIDDLPRREHLAQVAQDRALAFSSSASAGTHLALYEQLKVARVGAQAHHG